MAEIEVDHTEEKARFEQQLYNLEAMHAYVLDPKAAFRKYGLPCYCGHFGGCQECEER